MTKVIAESGIHKGALHTIIEIKNTDLIISDFGNNRICVRKNKDLSVVKVIDHDLGDLFSGLSFAGEEYCYLGFSKAFTGHLA